MEIGDVLLTLTALLMLAMVRNYLVYRIRTKAIDAIYARQDWMDLRNRLDSPSYNQMMFDLRHWTFKGFYPDL